MARNGGREKMSCYQGCFFGRPQETSCHQHLVDIRHKQVRRASWCEVPYRDQVALRWLRHGTLAPGRPRPSAIKGGSSHQNGSLLSPWRQ